ncbi:MAG: hypothetical protein KF699_01140 [Phycisphaeraceae bacterium]|nr:hypothetical protein [Phycisphaeraceae bacterium]MBX3406042.1 hypothetical protein [Phycisphaeraceae bacterium]
MKFGFTIAGLAGATFAAMAQAQSAPGSHAEPVITAEEARARPEIRFEIRPRISHAFRADFDDAAADVSVTRAGLSAGWSYAVNDRLRLGMSADFESSWYDFGNASMLPGGDAPLDSAASIRFGPNIFYAISQQWSVFAGAGPEFSGAYGADVGDSFTFGGYVGARYAFSENFALSFGVQGRTRLEEDARLLPLLGIEWQITDDVRLTTEGPGVRLTVRLDEAWSFSIGAAWELREYRLEDDAPIPEGVLRDSRFVFGAGFDYTPSQWVTLSLFGGVVAWQEFRFDDRDGNELLEDNTDPTGFIGFSATFRF